MSDSWAPTPRGGRKIDWGSAPSEEPVGPAWGVPAEETPSAAPEQTSDDLDDLFDDSGTEAPKAPAEAAAWGGATPQESAAESESGGLDDLFGTDEGDAGAEAEATGEVPGTLAWDEPAGAGLDDLFAEESSSEESSSEESQVKESPIEAAVEAAPAVDAEPAPSLVGLLGGAARPMPSQSKPEKAAKAGNAQEQEMPRRRKITPPVANDLPAVVVASGGERSPERSREEGSAEEGSTEESSTGQSSAGRRTLASQTPLASQKPLASQAPLAEQATAAGTAWESMPPPVGQEPVAQSSMPAPGRLDLAGRRKAAEGASMGLVDAAAAREQMNMNTQYQIPTHLWTFVDRLLGYVAATPPVQNVVNPFVLTRDKILDSEQRRTWQETIAPRLLDANVQIGNPMDVQAIFDLSYDELIGISVLGPLWRDESITEILVDGWDKVVVERGGKLISTPITFRDAMHAARVARDLAQKVSDRALTPTNPLVTAQLPGARVTFAYGAVVKSGLSISLRKFVELLGIEKLLEFGALNEEMVDFLKECVEARATVLVSGGTGTGKTTQINALSQFIPDEERVITIEDAFELQLANRHVVSLQTKEKSSADDQIIITQADLLVSTLRMRPDRVIVGEIREGQGAVVMLQAANTGHDGTMTTIHAQTSAVALNERLADMVMSVTGAPSEVVRRSVASAVDLVVQVTRKHGRRFISEIAVVDRTCMKNGMIEPESVFVGDVNSEGKVEFRHVGGLRPDTDLGAKLVDAGFDLSKWEPRK